MTENQTYARLDEMLSNPKTKNFLNHLIRAYFPVTNVDKVWERPKGTFKCVISGDELFSAQDILQGIQTEEFKKDFMDNLKSMFSDEPKTEHPIAKLVGERKMGVTGTNTTTFMSYPILQDFYNWIIAKSLNNDKHINWLLRSIRNANQPEVVIPKPVKHTNGIKESTYTLGETDTFKKLKAKFKE
jgi:hypothetical protein